MNRTTYSQKTAEVTRHWHLTDAKGKILGQLAADTAVLLMGKHKPTYTTHIDAGDFVVITNCKEIVVTGRKAQQKIYRRHSSFPGGMHEMVFAEVMEKHPERIIQEAVFSMLPKNRLRTARMARLKIYPGAEHPHVSQMSAA